MIKYPRKDSIDYFEENITTHSKVSSISPIRKCYYEINRISHSSINLVLTNIYIVSVADVYEILKTFQKVDCIVTLSSWNYYSNDAKDYCKENNIGLFKYNELLGALNYEGKKFVNYTPPEKDKKDTRSKFSY